MVVALRAPEKPKAKASKELGAFALGQVPTVHHFWCTVRWWRYLSSSDYLFGEPLCVSIFGLALDVHSPPIFGVPKQTVAKRQFILSLITGRRLLFAAAGLGAAIVIDFTWRPAVRWILAQWT